MEKEVLAKDEAMNEMSGKFTLQQNQITSLTKKLDDTTVCIFCFIYITY